MIELHRNSGNTLGKCQPKCLPNKTVLVASEGVRLLVKNSDNSLPEREKICLSFPYSEGEEQRKYLDKVR